MSFLLQIVILYVLRMNCSWPSMITTFCAMAKLFLWITWFKVAVAIAYILECQVAKEVSPKFHASEPGKKYGCTGYDFFKSGYGRGRSQLFKHYEIHYQIKDTRHIHTDFHFSYLRIVTSTTSINLKSFKIK